MSTIAMGVVTYWWAAAICLWALLYAFTSSSVSDQIRGFLAIWLMPSVALFLLGVWFMTSPDEAQTTRPALVPKVTVGLLFTAAYCGVAYLVSRWVKVLSPGLPRNAPGSTESASDPRIMRDASKKPDSEAEHVHQSGSQ